MIQLKHSPILQSTLLVIAGCILLSKTDIFLTSLFYDAAREGFHLKTNLIVSFVHHMVPYMVGALIALILAGLVRGFLQKKAFLGLKKHYWLFLLLALALGPGLMVNTVFKDQWGRARPVQISQFGGTKNFTRAFIPTDQCSKNCSFVSGHASVGFFLAAFAYCYKRRFKWWMTIGVLSGSMIGLFRIMEGGHFFTDVVASGLVVLLVNHITYLAVKRLHKTARFLH